MTLNTFPNTPTLAWSVMKAPNWATRLQRAISGRELRVNDYILPIYTFTLTYEVLRDRWDVRDGVGHGPAYKYYGGTTTVLDELRQVWNFFNQQRGSTLPFQFHDPTDNTTRSDPATFNAITVGVGDGMTTSFQLCSSILAPVIPTGFTISPGGFTTDLNTGVITYSTPPGSGVSITFDGTYNYKVRFTNDALEAENFMYQLWSMKQLKLTTVYF